MIDGMGKIQPMAIESEVYVIGSILIDNSAMAEAVDMLTPEMFYEPKNMHIYTACLNLYARNSPIDFISVKVELQRLEALELSGGPMYLVETSARVASAAHVGYHCRLIVEKFLLRRMGKLSSWINNKVYDPTVDVFELISDVEGLIFKITQQNVSQEVVRFETAVNSEVKQITQRFLNKDNGTTYGIPSGYYDIDSITGNFKESELIILAARPSMGKTALAINIAKNVAKYDKKSVAVFSLEMSKEQLIQRVIVEETGYSLNDIQKGNLTAHDVERIDRITNEIKDISLYIDDTASISLFALRTKCRKIKAEKGLDLIVIDYLQLMTVGDSQKNRNREQEISTISRGLKQLAKELMIPIIALSQLSRSVELTKDKKPLLSSLRESGAIEADADLVIMLYRPEYYKITEDENGESTEGVCWVLIPKNRNGKTGEVKMIFDGSRFRFETFGTQQVSPKLEPPKSFFPSDMYNDDSDNTGNLKDVPF
jgi:replicative DNA helicase